MEKLITKNLVSKKAKQGDLEKIRKEICDDEEMYYCTKIILASHFFYVTGFFI